jgi:phosphoesterase RecJ-like protein
VCDRSADEAFGGIVERLAAAQRLLIVTHARPDGDALGTMAALASAARASGRSAKMLVPGGDVPAKYAFLFAEDKPAGAEAFAALADEADLVVVVDTCAFAQLDGLEPSIRPRRGKVVVADHHATSDDVGAIQWVDATAAAAGVMAVELIDALGWPLDAAAAEALLTAMTTDTGWFRFSNTDARCLRAAARLFELAAGEPGAGLHPDELYMRLFQVDRPQRIQLLVRALESLALHHDGRIAVMTLRRSDFAETGALPAETENIVNEALRMGCVEVSILLVESVESRQAEGATEELVVRGSLRSRGRVDVSQVARRFGGGGHVRAAGLRRAEEIDALARQLVDACAEVLGEEGSG